jgi:protoporphyrinogen oxidase
VESKQYQVCVLGAGPAGLAAAAELIKHGMRNILIIDKNNVVGGLSRTITIDGIRFDVGPHRFFTKNREVNQFWHDILGADFVAVDRLTRILYDHRFFKYPISPFNALRKLGFFESAQAILSFGQSKLHRRAEITTFEDWTINKFGKKLYETFFKAYTEKVWGIPCHEIGAEWAAQRIKGLDVTQILMNALFGRTKKKVKTLAEQFDYPILGAGQMYEALSEKIVNKGVDIWLKSKVEGINSRDHRIESIDIVDEYGDRTKIYSSIVFSSIPLTHFFKLLKPQPSRLIKNAVEALYYRDHITVDILVDAENLFQDQWIYIHSPDIRMARLANYNNFSRAMVGYRRKTALSVEYFVFQHEDLWRRSDEELKDMAIAELSFLGLIKKESVEGSWVVRETECYPTYYIGFEEPYEIVKSEVENISGLYPIGRAGMYKYNNQDHSIMSGFLAARNHLKLFEKPYKLWNINIDAEYHESERR